ncbi:hypothetical protein AcW1_004058 [Taiwanofungus camphoratus]|nr:hypothetical protein AcW1_004058 [Antrodia cinnamomea]
MALSPKWGSCYFAQLAVYPVAGRRRHESHRRPLVRRRPSHWTDNGTLFALERSVSTASDAGQPSAEARCQTWARTSSGAREAMRGASAEALESADSDSAVHAGCSFGRPERAASAPLSSSTMTGRMLTSAMAAQLVPAPPMARTEGYARAGRTLAHPPAQAWPASPLLSWCASGLRRSS